MMAPDKHLVKSKFESIRDVVDQHPRTGWYIATLTTLNTILLLHIPQNIWKALS